jgi:hypothetical protein
MLTALRTALNAIFVFVLSGCFFPWRVMEPLEFTVIDAATEAPIPGARVVYLSCDVHDFGCHHAHLVKANSSADGSVVLPGRREWALLVPVPGNLPVPNHFVAVWAPSYSAYAYGQYGDRVASRTRGVTRQDILEAFAEIPNDQSSSDTSLNPSRELDGGKIRLRRLQP